MTHRCSDNPKCSDNDIQVTLPVPDTFIIFYPPVSMKPRLWNSLAVSIKIGWMRPFQIYKFIYVNNGNLNKAACPVYAASRFHAFHKYIFDLLFDGPEILSLQMLRVLEKTWDWIARMPGVATMITMLVEHGGMVLQVALAHR